MSSEDPREQAQPDPTQPDPTQPDSSQPDAMRARRDPDGARPGGDRDRHAQGMAVRREVLGDAHVDAAIARTDAVTADFQDLITRYAWGEIWTRPGLDRRSRSCVTLAVLAALHHDDELAIHVRAARRNGLTREEIVEVLLQVAIYAGVPAANRAFAIAQRTLADEQAANDDPTPHDDATRDDDATPDDDTPEETETAR